MSGSRGRSDPGLIPRSLPKIDLPGPLLSRMISFWRPRRLAKTVTDDPAKAPSLCLDRSGCLEGTQRNWGREPAYQVVDGHLQAQGSPARRGVRCEEIGRAS